MRILHAADLHLDSAFAALGAEKARQRRRESREVLTALAELARQEQVDLVLLAGKGHETYQEIRGVKYPLDEREEVNAYLMETEN